MKGTYWKGAYWAGAAALLTGAAVQTPARAQFAGFTGNARYEATTKSQTVPYGSVTFFPVAVFEGGGRFADGTSGTRTDFGALLAADFGVKPARTRAAFETGGWYWTAGNSDLYELHGRAYVTPEIGLQLSYIASTKIVSTQTAVTGTGISNGHAWATYLLYDLSSQKFGRKIRPRWGIKTGLGLFQDVSAGSKPTNFTYFISGSLEVAPRVSVNAGTWYVRDRSTDFNRLTVGLGYAF